MEHNTSKKTTAKGSSNELTTINVNDVIAKLFSVNNAKGYKASLWTMFSDTILHEEYNEQIKSDLILTFQEVSSLLDQLEQFYSKNQA